MNDGESLEVLKSHCGDSLSGHSSSIRPPPPQLLRLNILRRQAIQPCRLLGSRSKPTQAGDAATRGRCVSFQTEAVSEFPGQPHSCLHLNGLFTVCRRFLIPLLRLFVISQTPPYPFPIVRPWESVSSLWQTPPTSSRTTHHPSGLSYQTGVIVNQTHLASFRGLR